MNNKYIKLFVVTIMAFVVSMSVANAKSFNKLKDLTEYIEEQEGSENFGWIYIVGEHVFTSTYSDQLSLTDLSDGFQTIPRPNPTYIYLIERTYDGLNPSGWDIEGISNVLNHNAKLPETINIHYINTELTDDTVRSDDDVNLLVENANEAVKNPANESIYGAYELTFDDEEHVITVNIKKDLNLEDVNHSNVVATLYSILKRGTYSSIKIGDQIINARSVTTTNIKNALTNALTSLGSVDSLVDLATKSVDVVFETSKGISNVSSTKTYTIKFTAEVDTNTYFENTSSSINYAVTCNSIDDELCSPVLNILRSETKFDGIYGVASVINNALKLGSKKAIITFKKDDSSNPVSIEYTTSVVQGEFKSRIEQSDILGSNKKYSDLMDFEISIKFEADTEKGYTFANGETEVVYNFTIGSYLDLNSIIEKEFNAEDDLYTLSILEDGKTININVDLTNNVLIDTNVAKDLTNIAKGLNTLMDKTSSISKISINGKDYLKTVEGSDTDTHSELTANLRAILKTLISADSDSYAAMTIDKLLGMKEVTVEVTKTEETEFIPTATNVSGNKATYKVNLTFNGAKLENIVKALTMSSEHYSANYTKDVETNENILTIDLKNVNDKLSDLTGSNAIVLLANNKAILKSVTLNGVAIDYNKNNTAIRQQIVKALNVNEDTVLSDLVNKSFKVKMVLADKVNPAEDSESELEFTIKFTSSAIVTLTGATGEEALESLVNKENVEKIVLNEDYVINNGLLTISNDNLLITSDNNSKLTGNIVINAANVTISNVTINGKDLRTDENKAKEDVFVIKAASNNFTLENATISYTDTKNFAYGLVKVQGKVTIKGNTFDITNVKNPIEFDQTSLAKDGTVISGNTFTGDNYNLANDALNPKGKVDGARNVISIYGVAENNAAITISNNTFEYANWAVRISSYNTYTAIYYIQNNSVKDNMTHNVKDGKIYDDETALIGIQTTFGGNVIHSAANVIINHSGNTINGVAAVHNVDIYNSTKYEKYDRLVYTDSKNLDENKFATIKEV